MKRLGFPIFHDLASVDHGRLLWSAWGVVLAVLMGVFLLIFIQGTREWGVFRERESRSLARLAALEVEIAHEEAYLNAVLRDPAFIEHVARERLGYSRPGELLFRFK